MLHSLFSCPEPVYKGTLFPDVLPLAKNSDCFFRLSEMLPVFFPVVLAHSFPNQLYPLSQTVPMQFRRFLVLRSVSVNYVRKICMGDDECVK